MFLTADGTVISFFEHSADDVEYVDFFFKKQVRTKLPGC